MVRRKFALSAQVALSLKALFSEKNKALAMEQAYRDNTRTERLLGGGATIAKASANVPQVTDVPRDTVKQDERQLI